MENSDFTEKDSASNSIQIPEPTTAQDPVTNNENLDNLASDETKPSVSSEDGKPALSQDSKNMNDETDNANAESNEEKISAEAQQSGNEPAEKDDPNTQNVSNVTRMANALNSSDMDLVDEAAEQSVKDANGSGQINSEIVSVKVNVDMELDKDIEVKDVLPEKKTPEVISIDEVEDKSVTHDKDIIAKTDMSIEEAAVEEEQDTQGAEFNKKTFDEVIVNDVIENQPTVTEGRPEEALEQHPFDQTEDNEKQIVDSKVGSVVSADAQKECKDDSPMEEQNNLEESNNPNKDGLLQKESQARTDIKEDDKTDTKSNDNTEGDIVMIDSDLKSSDRTSGNEIDTKSVKPLKDDDIMVIDCDDLPKKTDNENSTENNNGNKPSKDDSDEIILVDSSVLKLEEPEGKPTDDNAKPPETSPENESINNLTGESSKGNSESTTDPDKPKDEQNTPVKTFVLDEKSGMFEEKETQPEEQVPQVFDDSDEDVVMVDNYVTTDRKSANKPVSKQSEPQASTTQELSTDLKKEIVAVECISMECKKQTKETAPAPEFVLNFYGLPKKSKKQRICVDCFDEVVEKYSILGGAVMDQQPLLYCEMPPKNELVEISDSSEEEEDEDVKQESEKPLPSDIISLVQNELNDILTDTFEKININQQVDWTEQIMKQKIAYNSKLSDEINNELNELQRKVDRIHLQLYSKSRPRYQDLPPCNIFEVDNSSAQHTSVTYRTRPAVQPAQQQTPQSQQRQITPISTIAQTTQSPMVSIAPKKEEFSRPPVIVGQFYFAVKQKLLSNWAECQIVESVKVADKSLYKVNFLYNQSSCSAPMKVVPAKYLAYRHSFNVKLPLGTRVIARFDAGTTQPASKQSLQLKNSSFYPGIIAESFGKYNRNRYLIFFDDGYAQYVTHGDVRVVCDESKEVWSDIHPHSQEFIKNYLMNYRSQRPMVQVKVGQRIITEWKGKWIYAKVIDIDASLVQLHFADDNRYEWIYRGSTRLGPLYQEKALSVNKASNKFSKFQKRNEPSIEYITLDDDDESDQSKQQDAKKSNTTQEQSLQSFKNLQLNQTDSANRSVAKKSTFHRATSTSQPSAVFMNSSTIYCEDDRPKGKIVYYTAKKHLPPLKYKPHECNPNCLFKITHNLKSYSPLAKPLLSGWERQLCKMKYKKVFVVYRAPCGRRVRNMFELHMYLRMTKATLNVENFDFDPMIHCLAEYVIENHIYHNPDLSDGREFMAVPCVNYFDDTKPPPCIYSTERIPTEGVNLNLDPDFLCGCDCEDDCIDKTRCQCWQLTIAGAKFGNPNTSVDNIGYVYKRLQEAVVTGIYECNSKCKCKSNCLNRVVQHPLMTKLQVFKTSNRGWGIRCLNDVAKGSFICIYSGHLLTEEAGNNICQMNENKAGDEYFADLDYIETVEQLKEGYETDVVESESEVESDYDIRQDSGASDDDFTASTNPTDAAVKTRSQARKDSRQKNDSKTEKKNQKKKEDTKTDSDDEREMVNLIPNSDMSKGGAPSPAIKFRSVRKYFGKHEQIYIMDAKKSGNLGRYFNHSCNPNLFVQNVFVDTHDLRFPWVAFFALCNVRAGSELTWNYNYDVGSVPGKVLYCQCGAENCRQRLL